MKEEHYNYWIAQLDAWCAKHHGITRRQAISILFEDSPFNPERGRDLIVRGDLFSAITTDCYLHYLNNVS